MASAEIPAAGSTFAGDDGVVSTVLPENYDPNYEPTEDELAEYAEFIGIDPAKEPNLLWIAKEGLQTPLPPEWRACQTGEDEVYYFNFKTGDSLWDHPMDEAFKQKVIKERAKMATSGKSSKEKTPDGTASASSVDAILSGNSSAKNPARGGSTKAIADSFMGKSAHPVVAGIAGKNPPLPPPLSHTGGPQPIPALSTRQTSSVEVFTPNSGVIPPSSASATSSHASPRDGTELTSPLYLGAIGGRATSFTSPTTQVPVSGAKDIEANMRRRIEDEYAPLRRQLGIDSDKKAMEEKRQLESDLKKLKKELDDRWEADRAKGTAVSLRDAQRQDKEIAESWQARIKRVTEEVVGKTKEVDQMRAELEHFRGESSEDVKRSLAERCNAEVEQRRATLKKAMEVELAKVKREQEASLAELRQREASVSASERAKYQAENAKKLENQAAQGEKILAGLEAEVKRKREELEKAQNPSGAATPVTASPTTTASDPTKAAAIAELKAKLAAYEAETEKEVEKTASACLAEVAKLRKGAREEEDKLQSTLDALKASHTQSTPSTPFGRLGANSGAPEAARSSSSTTGGLSFEEANKLAAEEDRLQRDLQAAVHMYNLQTDALVLRQSRPPGGTGSAVSRVSSRTFESPTTPASSAARWNTGSPGPMRAGANDDPLSVKLRGMEAEHEEHMRALREECKRAYREKSLDNPRETSEYSALYAEKQKAWAAENPPPSADAILPQLTPVPASTSVLMDMPEVPPPTKEEVEAVVAGKVKELREEMQRQQEKELHELDARKKTELAKLKSEYRQQRIKEVEVAVQKHRQELGERAAGAAQPASAGPKPTATLAGAAPDDAAAVQARQQQVADLTAKVAAATAARASQDAESQARIDALTRQISELDALIRAANASAADAGRAGEAVAEPTVIVQLDYARYMSNEEAAAEEAALHAKWRGLLEDLRREIRDLANATEQAHQQLLRRVLSPGVAAAERPPTVPTTASTPSCATPIVSRVPPREATAGAGNDSLVTAASAWVPALQLTAAPYSVNASSIRPSPVAARTRGSMAQEDFAAVQGLYRDPNASLSAIGYGASSPLLTPFASPGLGALRNENTTFGRLSSPSPAPAPNGAAELASEGLPSASLPVMRQQTEQQQQLEERVRQLAGLHSLLRTQRRELRARQTRMESLREEWRQDMRRCRDNRDRAQAILLKKIKLKLEAEAQDLNEAVLSLKEASALLRQEETQLRAAVSGPSESSAAVLEALYRLTERTERLESLLLSHDTAAPAESPSLLPAVAHTADRHSSAATATQSGLQQRVLSDEQSVSAVPVNDKVDAPALTERADNKPKSLSSKYEASVEQWLREQQER